MTKGLNMLILIAILAVVSVPYLLYRYFYSVRPDTTKEE